MKKSLNGVSLWASGLGTESHICQVKSTEIKVNKKVGYLYDNII